MAEYTGMAMPRPGWTPMPNASGDERREALRQWTQQQLAINPNFAINEDQYYVDDNGVVQFKQDPWIERNPWIWPIIGIGGGIGAHALGFGGSAASAAGPTMEGGATVAANLGSASALPAAAAGGGMAAGMAGAAGAAGSAAASRSVLSRIGEQLARVGLPLGALAAGQAFGPGSGMPAAGTSQGIPPQLQELLALSMQRMRDQDPLFKAVNRQAFEGLPQYAKEGQ